MFTFPSTIFLGYVLDWLYYVWQSRLVVEIFFTRFLRTHNFSHSPFHPIVNILDRDHLFNSRRMNHVHPIMCMGDVSLVNSIHSYLLTSSYYQGIRRLTL